ncbi:site-2 protease family protein [Candidatus Roizmanbacteria bacterium]|nr:site-2 protease family protein [Candidatus Roizmanbacteria bacterium]
MINQLFSNPFSFVISIAALIVAITIHEFSHAWMADRLGDPTPRIQRRLNLNPLSHLDPYGSLFMLFFGFGWGKPVIFDPYNLKNPRKDAAFISLAGPISNILLALVCSLLLRVALVAPVTNLATVATIVLAPLISINIFLAIFNLIPIHPLDGFKVVEGALPENKAREWRQLERYGFIFLLLMILPIGPNQMPLLETIIRPISYFLLQFLYPASFF